jgi:hypothetical protein
MIRGELGSSRFKTFGQLSSSHGHCSIILLLSFFSIALPFIPLLVRQFLKTILPVASKYDVARLANSIPYKGFRARNMGWVSSSDSLAPAMANYRSFSGCVQGRGWLYAFYSIAIESMLMVTLDGMVVAHMFP